MGIQQKTENYSLGEWRWAEDDIAPTDDKQIHAVGSFGLYYLFTKKGMHPKRAVISIFSLGLAKECIDAMVPWELYGRIGGDGFSRYDILYNALGLFTAYTLDERWTISYRNGHINVIYNSRYR